MQLLIHHKQWKWEEKWVNIIDHKRKAQLYCHKGCKAQIKFGYDKRKLKWVVSDFVIKHSHEMMPLEYAQFDSLFWHIDETTQAQINSLRMSGVPPKHIMEYLARQFDGH